MKKENVYVKTKSREQADLYRNVLKEIGQTIREDFNTNTQLDDPDLDYRENGWILGYASASKKEITFGQLIDLLNEPQKIAVRVENEKEFKALMKYYDSLGYRHWNLDNGWIGSYVTFEKEYNWLLDGQTEDYQIIPFSEFAVKRNIKLPYFTTIDKVDVYYEDEFYWMTEKHHVPVQSFMLGSMPDSDLLCFSTKQAALDWIEAQKPKSEILGMNNSTQEAEVFKDGKVLIRYAGMEIPIHYYDISRLQEAYKRLNK